MKADAAFESKVTTEPSVHPAVARRDSAAELNRDVRPNRVGLPHRGIQAESACARRSHRPKQQWRTGWPSHRTSASRNAPRGDHPVSIGCPRTPRPGRDRLDRFTAHAHAAADLGRWKRRLAASSRPPRCTTHAAADLGRWKRRLPATTSPSPRRGLSGDPRHALPRAHSPTGPLCGTARISSASRRTIRTPFETARDGPLK